MLASVQVIQRVLSAPEPISRLPGEEFPMHSIRSRSRLWLLGGWRHHRPRVVAIGIALLLSISLVHDLTVPETPGPFHGTTTSCKPLPPYGVELTAVGDTQWSLTLRNSGSAKDLVVWMWCEVDDAGATRQRQQVWAGRLDTDSQQQVPVRYAPESQARRVWASLESADQSVDLQAATLRGVAVAAGPAAANMPRRKNHVVTEDPVTGQRVEQYVGQGGIQ
jgi:hypothetical protein